MRKIVLTYGLIAGVILSVMMLATLPFMDAIGFDRGEVIGYTTMVVAFLLIFFGIRSYRDNVAGGSVGFGRAFAVGALIVAVASVCYVLTWQVIYFKLAPDFGAKYQAHMIDKARASGESQAEIDKKVAKDGKPGVSLDWFNMLYQVLLGQEKGPRFGSFVAVYGLQNTVDMIDGALARSA